MPVNLRIRQLLNLRQTARNAQCQEEFDTVGNLQKAGFKIRREENVYLDILKIIEGVKEAA
jgi:hypothetical protein